MLGKHILKDINKRQYCSEPRFIVMLYHADSSALGLVLFVCYTYIVGVIDESTVEGGSTYTFHLMLFAYVLYSLGGVTNAAVQ